MSLAKLNRKSRRRWVIGGMVALAFTAVVPTVQAQTMADAFVIFEERESIPDHEFTREDGSFASLADFRGKTILLNIWATWCGPCRREMPTLDRLRALLGGDDFDVVALSIDRGGVEAVRPFFREIGIERLEIYIDSAGKTARALKVAGLPTTFLIDRRGKKAGMLVGPAEWDAPDTISFLRKQIAGQKRSQGPLEIQVTHRQ